MKIQRIIYSAFLIVLFLTFGLVFAQGVNGSNYNKGVEYAAQGKFKEAREEFEKALKVDSYYGSAKRALKVIEDVTEKKLKSKTVIHIFKGITYTIKGQAEEAITEHNKAIEINPKYAYTFHCRGLVYLKKGMYDKAISDYNRYIEINPRDALAYNNRGLAYYNKVK